MINVRHSFLTNFFNNFKIYSSYRACWFMCRAEVSHTLKFAFEDASCLAAVELIYCRKYRNTYDGSASLKVIASIEGDAASLA